MAWAVMVIGQLTTVVTLPKRDEWTPADGSNMANFYKVSITLDRECRDWSNGKSDLPINQLYY
uniref:Uncharacterized protein n=1 Tax=Arion vulgaris TaxID=1028688 RepID=A0A0B7B9Z6_9EUPU